MFKVKFQKLCRDFYLFYIIRSFRFLKEIEPGNESKSNRKELMAIRKQIGEKLATQKKEYETLQNTSNGLPPHETNEKLRGIFEFPEVAIPNLLKRLPASDEPRKFRRTKRNTIGFEIMINDEAELELLDGYAFNFDFDKCPNKVTPVKKFLTIE